MNNYFLLLYNMMEVHQKRKRVKAFAAIPMSGPIVKMNQMDWHHEMAPLDQAIYKLFWLYATHQCSPERLHMALKKSRSFPDLTLKDVWDSLDKPVMRKYVFRMGKFLWALLTEGQIKAIL